MRPRGDTQKRYKEALQCLSGKKSPEKSGSASQESLANTMKLREACPQLVIQLWNAIAFVRQQKQIPNLDRIALYMKRMHDVSQSVVEAELKKAVHDGLIKIRTAVGCKGSKIGVEQDGYRIPESEMNKGDHDWYCFNCHKGGDVALCSSCYRVFHLACIEGKYDPVKFVCNVCKLHKTKYLVDLKKDELNALLCHTSVRLKEKTRELHRIPHPSEERWRFDFFIYRPMDLITMEQKMRKNEYETPEEYYADALQIVHNVIVYFGDNCKIAYLARQMLFDCDYDLNEISQCRDCYRMSNQKDDRMWFCKPCNPPHELVFAKQRGYPYWPAKVMKKENGYYDVRFFSGFHQRAHVEEAYVKPITTTIQQLGLKKTESLKRALKELNHHQSLLASNKYDKNVVPSKVKTDKLKIGKVKELKTQEDKPLIPRRPGRPPKIKKDLPPDDVSQASTTKKRKLTKCRELEPEEKKSVKDVSRSVKSPKSVKESQSKATALKGQVAEDQNIVSSSSQEALVSYVTAATQTLPIEPLEMDVDPSQASDTSTKSCDCKSKYGKMFREMNESLETEHKEDKAKALQELSEKLHKEMEAEKQKAISAGFLKLRQKMEQLQKKSEEQSRLLHEQKLQKLTEHHKQQISETKKKQWCYNCEAEAIYHCCWNTAYCSVECQQSHWHKEHKRSCRRKR